MRRSPHPRVDLEIAAVRLCHRPRAEAIETVLERLEQAEARLRGFGSGAEPAGPVQADLLGAPAAPALPQPVAVPRPVERVAPPAPRGGSRASRAPADPRCSGPRARARVRPRRGAPRRPGPAIVAEVTRVRPTLGHLLADGVVVGEEDGRLTVAVPNGSKFAQDRLKDVESRELVNETARRLCPGLRDVQLTTGVPPAGLGVPAHPLVQAAIDLFDAEVTQVRAGPGARGGRPRRPGCGGEAP